MRVSWAPPEVSSTRVRIGRRWLVRNVSPRAARSFMNQARLHSIDIHSVTSFALNAQVSTTCEPWVLITLTRWPFVTRAATPRRAGIVRISVVAMARSPGLLSLAAPQPVVAAIVGGGGRPPAREQRRIGLPDLHPERPAGRQRIPRLGPPHLHRQIAVGARRYRAEHVDLGEEFEEVPLLGRAGLDEVPVVRGQPGDLEDVQHVVDIQLVETVRGDRAHEIRVAAEVEVLAVEHLVHVGVAAGPEEIVATRPVLVAPVADAVVGDREHRPQVRQAGPEAVVGGDVRAVKLLGASGPEALARITEAPRVEVGDLRPLHRDYAEEVARPYRPRATRAHRNHESLDQGPGVGLGGQAVVERTIDRDRRARLRFVDDAWLRHVAPPWVSHRIAQDAAQETP